MIEPKQMAKNNLQNEGENGAGAINEG